jgi:hypothetical protein
MGAFKVGDWVEWTSQSAGVSKRKCGEVVQVIAAGAFCRSVHGAGLCRDHESYVVKVGYRRYWPRVAHLTWATSRFATATRRAGDKGG